jgi:hypothetical protein
MPELDELENAHAKVGGKGPGRKYLTREINHAYLVAVAGHFQRFCRDLHSEAAQRLADAVEPRSFRGAVLRLLTDNRKLDTGNAHDGTLGPDFDRLGLSFLTEADAANGWNKRRRRRLEQLNIWRNAVVHQDFKLKSAHEPVVKGTNPHHISYVRMWRQNCSELAYQFDRVVRAHLIRVVGGTPWE